MFREFADERERLAETRQTAIFAVSDTLAPDSILTAIAIYCQTKVELLEARVQGLELAFVGSVSTTRHFIGRPHNRTLERRADADADVVVDVGSSFACGDRLGVDGVEYVDADSGSM